MPQFDYTARTAEGQDVQGTVTAGSKQETLHILCPAGHELETPREMLGQDAMCPYCQTQFRLRIEDSVEYRKEQEEARMRRDMQIGKSWIHPTTWRKLASGFPHGTDCISTRVSWSTRRSSGAEVQQ